MTSYPALHDLIHILVKGISITIHEKGILSVQKFSDFFPVVSSSDSELHSYQYDLYSCWLRAAQINQY